MDTSDNNKRKNRRNGLISILNLHFPEVAQLVFLSLIAVVTLCFGWAATGSLTGLWNSTGLLIGETSYKDYPEFSGLAEPQPPASSTKQEPVSPDAKDTQKTDSSSKPVPRPTFWEALWFCLARLSGLFFIFSALVILVFEPLRDTVRRLRVWRWRLTPWTRNYALICGLGWKGREIGLALLDKRRKVVVVEKERSNPFIHELRNAGAKVFIDDATDGAALDRIGAFHAREIYVVSADDEVNCRIVQQIENLLPACDVLPCKKEGEFKIEECDMCCAPGAVHCYVSVESFRSRFSLENRPRKPRMHVHCFNMEEITARQVFLNAVWPRLAAHNTRNMAIYIIGFTEVGREILLHALRSLHLRDEQQREIVVLCRDSEKQRREFLDEFPCLRSRAELSPEMREATDCIFPEMKFIELPLSNSAFLAGTFAPYGRIAPGWQTHIFHCLDDGVQSGALADLIQPCLQDLVNRTEDTEVYSHVYYNYPEDEEDACRPDLEPSSRCGGPSRFGAYACLCQPYFIAGAPSERNARAVHAFFHAKYPKCPQRADFGPPMNKEERDEDSKRERDKLNALMKASPRSFEQKPRIECYLDCLWEWVAEWERESNRQAADHIPVKLALLGLLMEEDGAIRSAGKAGGVSPSALEKRWKTGASGAEDAPSEELLMLARIEHRRWCAERLLGGWLPLCSDAERERWQDKHESKIMKTLLRRHADLTPFDRLDDGEKEKDHDIILATALLLKELPSVVDRALTAR